MAEQTFRERLAHAWNAFKRDPTPQLTYQQLGAGYSMRPDRFRSSTGNERSIITAVYNRIATDVASMDIQHVRLDENRRYLETMNSSLNQCFTVNANADQTGRNLIQDAVISMFDEGAVAIVPVETSFSPANTEAYDIMSLRVGKILEWYPQHIRVQLYNEQSGRREELILPKKLVAIVENPFYAVMNEPSSTLKRLVRKLNILDAVDEQSGSGKLDLIIQLPYIIKTPARKLQAEERRKDIEMQLASSKYGIAYTDGTERVTQLNRPVENNLMAQITYLTELLYSQLGMTTGVLDGTADEKTMLNYYNRTVEVILSALVDSMRWKFLTKTARTQKQDLVFFRNPFKLVPVSDLADIADKLTRNEILTSNEIRAIIGYKPSKDPKADELRNKNISASDKALTQEPVNEGGKLNEEI